MKKYFIHTSGCQMNEHDSERMGAILESQGFVLSDSIDAASLVIINTCSVRQKPEDKVFNMLTQLKHRKKRQKDLVLAVTGCVAQQKGQSLLQEFPFVDLVIGPDEIDGIFSFYSTVNKSGGNIVGTSFSEKVSYNETLVTETGHSTGSAFVTVMKGCNCYCSYCIVPYVRGPERSRSINEVVSDVKRLVSEGVSTVTLLGQNISRFGRENNENLATLLYKIGELKGLKRFSFITSHPKDFSLEVIKCFEEIKNLAPYLHLPVQHGSNKILKAMNRGYTRDDFCKIIDAINVSKVADSIVLTTDVIIGFPGEEDSDFQELLYLLRYAKFDNSFSFIYSPRPGTAAYKKYGSNEDENNRSTYVNRLMRYQEEQKIIAMQKNKKMEGRTCEIVVIGRSDKDLQKFTGRTDGGKVVNFEPLQGIELKVGQYLKVIIEKAYPTHLFGRIQ